MKQCYSCKKALEIDGRPARGDSCPYCGADMKACKNCRFYDTGAYNDCAEPQAERVVEKERSNFCDYFVFSDTDKSDSKEESAPKDKMAGLKGLFKD